jgi:hypothetical protein
MKRIALLPLLFVMVVSMASADFLWWKTRDPVRDIGKAAGHRLTDEEAEIARFGMTFYCVKFGYIADGTTLDDSFRRMKDEEYSFAVKQSAKLCTNGAAKGLLRLGKAGEKLLKAIIVTAEDAARAAGEYIDRKAQSYDQKK